MRDAADQRTEHASQQQACDADPERLFQHHGAQGALRHAERAQGGVFANRRGDRRHQRLTRDNDADQQAEQGGEGEAGPRARLGQPIEL